ncbi:MAG TPA: EamA family transporter, partial [Candidatus Acidoferrum sp.]|nr:EamA family transporter [Candidatus Acidoferrum sp.]
KTAANKESTEEGAAYWLAVLRNPWVLIGVGCFVVEFVVWLAFLSLVELAEGVLLGSINIVAIMLAGRWFFHERLNRLRIVGIGLVALGVAVVGTDA